MRLVRHTIRDKPHTTKTHFTMDTTDEKQEEPLKSGRAAISLPEHMDRSVKRPGNRPQSTAGSNTPGRARGRKDMSEAAERKARRDAIVAEEKRSKNE